MIHFWMLFAFQPLANFLDLSYAHNHLDFVNVSLVVVLLHESDVLLPEVGENDFALITVGQVWPDVVITTFVIAIDARNKMRVNSLVQLLLCLDSELRLSNE